MNNDNISFKESSFCKNFVKCVKENYNLIIKINMFENKDLDNLLFYSYIKQMSETANSLLSFDDILFPHDFPESKYFNNVLEKSKSLSKVAYNVLYNNAPLEALFLAMNHYGDDNGKWLTLYSLLLK